MDLRSSLPHVSHSVLIMTLTVVLGADLAVLPAGAETPPEHAARDLRLLRPGQPGPDPGAWLRVVRGDRVQEGELAAQPGDSLVWRTDGVRHASPLAHLDGVWVRGRHTRRGLTLGGITGGAAGLGFGILVASVLDELCDYDCAGGGTAVAVVMVTTAGGALGGAVLGALVGSTIPRWDRVYP